MHDLNRLARVAVVRKKFPRSLFFLFSRKSETSKEASTSFFTSSNKNYCNSFLLCSFSTINCNRSNMKLLQQFSVLTVICINSANAYITSLSQEGAAAPWKKNSFGASPPANVELDDVFRQEYQVWANRYGKSTDDESRFENFKLNYMLQMQHNKRTGQFADLNEFGDSKFLFEKSQLSEISDSTLEHYDISRLIHFQLLTTFVL